MLETQQSRYGAIARSLPFTPGKIFFVFKSDDAQVGDFLNEFPPDRDGQVRVFTSVSAAYDATTTDNNDVIILMGDGTHSLSAMLTVSKNRVHFYGVDYFLGANRPYGCSAKLSLGVTTAATDIGTVKNTGVRNSFHNIKFLNSNTVTEGIYCFVEGGEYTYMENCEIYKSTDLDVTGAAEMVMNGDSAYIKNCTIGSLADARSGAVIRANVLLTKELAGSGKVSRDVTFEQCRFWIQCTNTANRFVYSAADADVERNITFNECHFICNGASSAIPAQNVSGAATFTVGNILLNNCVSVEAGTAMSTTTGVFVNGPVPAADTTGISLQAS